MMYIYLKKNIETALIIFVYLNPPLYCFIFFEIHIKYRTYYIKNTEKVALVFTKFIFWSRMIWWKKIRSDIKKQILDYHYLLVFWSFVLNLWESLRNRHNVFTLFEDG